MLKLMKIGRKPDLENTKSEGDGVQDIVDKSSEKTSKGTNTISNEEHPRVYFPALKTQNLIVLRQKRRRF